VNEGRTYSPRIGKTDVSISAPAESFLKTSHETKTIVSSFDETKTIVSSFDETKTLVSSKDESIFIFSAIRSVS
jgi:hypothetical protein